MTWNMVLLLAAVIGQLVVIGLGFRLDSRIAVLEDFKVARDTMPERMAKVEANLFFLLERCKARISSNERTNIYPESGERKHDDAQKPF